MALEFAGLPDTEQRLEAAGYLPSTSIATVTYLADRLGLDPDTYGIPIITASVDLIGFMSLIIAMIFFGIAG